MQINYKFSLSKLFYLNFISSDFLPFSDSLEPCEIAHYQGDGFCDDGNNHDGCGYDGGDCCDNDKHNAFIYCVECQCLDPNHKGR